MPLASGRRSGPSRKKTGTGPCARHWRVPHCLRRRSNQHRHRRRPPQTRHRFRLPPPHRTTVCHRLRRNGNGKTAPRRGISVTTGRSMDREAIVRPYAVPWATNRLIAMVRAINRHTGDRPATGRRIAHRPATGRRIAHRAETGRRIVVPQATSPPTADLRATVRHRAAARVATDRPIAGRPAIVRLRAGRPGTSLLTAADHRKDHGTVRDRTDRHEAPEPVVRPGATMTQDRRVDARHRVGRRNGRSANGPEIRALTCIRAGGDC